MDIIFWLIMLYIAVMVLVWLLPKLFIVALVMVGVGIIIGLPVGVYYGIKNYVVAIRTNITNKTFKAIMYSITTASILIIVAYLTIAAYFLIIYVKGGFAL